jgi:aldehyde:ferredoxin oxidoreductase
MRSFELRGGSAGKILRVDLSRNRVWTENTAAYAARFLGGRAVNSLILRTSYVLSQATWKLHLDGSKVAAKVTNPPPSDDTAQNDWKYHSMSDPR